MHPSLSAVVRSLTLTHTHDHVAAALPRCRGPASGRAASADTALSAAVDPPRRRPPDNIVRPASRRQDVLHPAPPSAQFWLWTRRGAEITTGTISLGRGGGLHWCFLPARVQLVPPVRHHPHAVGPWPTAPAAHDVVAALPVAPGPDPAAEPCEWGRAGDDAPGRGPRAAGRALRRPRDARDAGGHERHAGGPLLLRWPEGRRSPTLTPTPTLTPDHRDSCDQRRRLPRVAVRDERVCE